MGKWTPGKWETGECSWNDDGEVRYTLRGFTEAKAADARMIAAAPELADMLAELVSDVFYVGGEIVIRCEDHAAALRKVADARALLARVKGDDQ